MCQAWITSVHKLKLPCGPFSAVGDRFKNKKKKPKKHYTQSIPEDFQGPLLTQEWRGQCPHVLSAGLEPDLLADMLCGRLSKEGPFWLWPGEAGSRVNGQISILCIMWASKWTSKIKNENPEPVKHKL